MGSHPKLKPGHLGRAILTIRKQLGWSQYKLAEKSGLTRQSIINVEHGFHDPQVSTVLRLIAAFGGKLEIRYEQPRVKGNGSADRADREGGQPLEAVMAIRFTGQCDNR